jgi:hypothetical protein
LSNRFDREQLQRYPGPNGCSVKDGRGIIEKVWSVSSEQSFVLPFLPIPDNFASSVRDLTSEDINSEVRIRGKQMPVSEVNWPCAWIEEINRSLSDERSNLAVCVLLQFQRKDISERDATVVMDIQLTVQGGQKHSLAR